jgi:transcriptional regulator with XRE-family HTH domain
MSEKSELINKFKTNKKTRESYVRAKININLPSQIRALRLRRNMKQEDLAREAEMMQPRISAMERPGSTKFNIETLIRLAAAFKVGLVVKFVSFSEMLRWENEFSQDNFSVTTIDDDIEFQKEEQPAVSELPNPLPQTEAQKVVTIEPQIVSGTGSASGFSHVSAGGLAIGGAAGAASGVRQIAALRESTTAAVQLKRTDMGYVSGMHAPESSQCMS